MPRNIAYAYIAAWGACCIAALVVAWRRRADPSLLGRAHVRALRAPWKIALFVPALVFFVVVAPYTGDPTWDRVDATFMSVLTYLTAPWSVGALYRAARGHAPRPIAFVAACTWLFSASFSYDLYIFIRDGDYPSSWSGNIVASSVLYASAGLLFSLHHESGRGVIFDFMSDPWPKEPAPARPAMIGLALALVALVVAMMAPFFWEPLRLFLYGVKP